MIREEVNSSHEKQVCSLLDRLHRVAGNLTFSIDQFNRLLTFEGICKWALAVGHYVGPLLGSVISRSINNTVII